MHARHRRIGRFSLGTAVIAMSAVLVGCGTGTTGKQQPAAAADRTFTYAVNAVPEHLDLTPWGGNGSKILYGVLDTSLVSYNNSCDKIGGADNIRPNLAKSWEFSADGKSLTVHLGDAVSSWGNEITSADVEWSLRRELANQGSLPSNWGKIGSYDMENLIEVIDEKTIKLSIKERKSFDATQLASTLVAIHDSTEAKKHATTDDPWALAWVKKNTADFGPWKLERFSPGSEIVLVPNPNYVGERGNFNKVVIRAVPESAVRLQLLQSGDVDWADALAYQEYAQLEKDDKIVVEECASGDRDELFLQQKFEPFSDVRVRQAMAAAIDRQRIVDEVYSGYGLPARDGLSQYFDFTPSKTAFEYDPERAKELLAEAGYPNGFSFTALFSEAKTGPYAERLMVQMQADLKKVGIDMKLSRVPGGAEFFQLVHAQSYEAVLYGDSTYVEDPSFAAGVFVMSTSSINSFNYKSAKYDDTLRAAQKAEGDERNRLLAEVAAIGVTEMPVLYVADKANVQAHRAGISGFENDPMLIHPAKLKTDK